MCVAILFLDIVNAFASLLRAIVFDIELSDEIWLRKLASCGFDGADVHDIYRQACSVVWSSVRDSRDKPNSLLWLWQPICISTRGLPLKVSTVL